MDTSRLPISPFNAELNIGPNCKSDRKLGFFLEDSCDPLGEGIGSLRIDLHHPRREGVLSGIGEKDVRNIKFKVACSIASVGMIEYMHLLIIISIDVTASITARGGFWFGASS